MNTAESTFQTSKGCSILFEAIIKNQIPQWVNCANRLWGSSIQSGVGRGKHFFTDALTPLSQLQIWISVNSRPYAKTIHIGCETRAQEERSRKKTRGLQSFDTIHLRQVLRPNSRRSVHLLAHILQYLHVGMILETPKIMYCFALNWFKNNQVLLPCK
jgi:hypothetical protein